jgi:hypothetical protein
MARFTVLALHRRAGKTELAIMELVERALRCKLELGLFAYVAPYLKQAKSIAWARLRQRCAPLIEQKLVEVNESELSIKFAHNGATIRLWGGDNFDGMRGLRLDFCVIDEVAQIKPELWQDVVRPALSDRLGGSLFIGTPSGLNLFSELYFRAATLNDWYAARYTVHDTGALEASEVEAAKREISETSFAREYLCDFAAAGDDQLISLQQCEDAARRELKMQDYGFAPIVVGVDPARFGDDRSAIVIRQGLLMYPAQVYRGLDNIELADKVAAVIEQYRPAAVFCDAGNGSGVIDYLRLHRHRITEVHFGGGATDPKFLNKRAEMWFAIRDWLKAGGGIPNDAGLKQDLAAPTYKFNAAGKIQLESKDEIKKRGMPSPDIADALAVTFAAKVSPESRDSRPSRAITE